MELVRNCMGFLRGTCWLETILTHSLSKLCRKNPTRNVVVLYKISFMAYVPFGEPSLAS